ncbi:MAG TPA: hypothetical protein PLO59_02935, partial [Bacteroidia bacterium]|nr:hypothetical protein [Bacteroidia bacterium]
VPLITLLLIITYIIFICLGHRQHLYTHTLQYLPNIACGIWLAYAMHFKFEWFGKIARWRLWVLILVPLLCYINAAPSGVMQILLLKALSLMVFGSVVAYLARTTFSSNQTFIYWGKRSYGLYIWHGVTLTIYAFVCKSNTFTGWQIAVAFLLCLLATHGLAWLCYRYIEMPFLRLKKHLPFLN